MSWLVALPIVIPMVGGAASMVAWRSRRAQRVIGMLTASSLFAAGGALMREVIRHGVLAMRVGDWPAPFGIVLVADLFSAAMVLVTGLIGLAVVAYSLVVADTRREAFGYYPLVTFLLMGVCGAFLTADIFNLYVWFEVMLISSFVLMALGGEGPQIQSAVKYVTLNLISSAIFLTAVGLLYGATGTLNMAVLAERIPEVAHPGLISAISMLFLVAFGIKAAVFPLHFWLPASYHTPPVAVSALFAGLLTKVGVYALIRVFTLLFVGDVGHTHRLILWTAGATMLIGVIGAVAQHEMRRILSFHIVSQIGYMVMGLGLFTKLAIAGSVFYIIHHIIVKANLFLISGVAQRYRGSFDLRRIGGLYGASPGLALLFLIPALSLAGMPPLSGFFAKLSLVRAGIEVEQYGIVAIALVAGLLTLFSMMKIWNEAFWKSEGRDTPIPEDLARTGRLLMWPIAVLATVTLLIGAASGPLFALAERAADQLLEPDAYIEAVLR
ncbi:MAG TPA: Na+/H+ antiporter subunit D [Thermoanaerobaculia bacterium]|nr:Na+/H+ antiporter subunit D [Thermoanaerobaculia bacterium]